MGCLHLKSSFKCLLDPFLYIYFDVSKIYKYSQSKISFWQAYKFEVYKYMFVICNLTQGFFSLRRWFYSFWTVNFIAVYLSVLIV